MRTIIRAIHVFHLGSKRRGISLRWLRIRSMLDPLFLPSTPSKLGLVMAAIWYRELWTPSLWWVIVDHLNSCRSAPPRSRLFSHCLLCDETDECCACVHTLNLRYKVRVWNRTLRSCHLTCGWGISIKLVREWYVMSGTWWLIVAIMSTYILSVVVVIRSMLAGNITGIESLLAHQRHLP